MYTELKMHKKIDLSYLLNMSFSHELKGKYVFWVLVNAAPLPTERVFIGITAIPSHNLGGVAGAETLRLFKLRIRNIVLFWLGVA